MVSVDCSDRSVHSYVCADLLSTHEGSPSPPPPSPDPPLIIIHNQVLSSITKHCHIVQLMRPDIGKNASRVVGDFVHAYIYTVYMPTCLSVEGSVVIGSYC